MSWGEDYFFRKLQLFQLNLFFFGIVAIVLVSRMCCFCFCVDFSAVKFPDLKSHDKRQLAEYF